MGLAPNRISRNGISIIRSRATAAGLAAEYIIEKRRLLVTLARLQEVRSGKLGSLFEQNHMSECQRVDRHESRRFDPFRIFWPSPSLKAEARRLIVYNFPLTKTNTQSLSETKSNSYLYTYPTRDTCTPHLHPSLPSLPYPPPPRSRISSRISRFIPPSTPLSQTILAKRPSGASLGNSTPTPEHPKPNKACYEANATHFNM